MTLQHISTTEKYDNKVDIISIGMMGLKLLAFPSSIPYMAISMSFIPRFNVR